MNLVPDSLEALFESSGAPLPFDAALAQELPQSPTTLDDQIGAEAAAADRCAGFRWYRGIDAVGIVRIFRFERGGSVEQWHGLLRSQTLQSVAGPFRSPIQARARLAGEPGLGRLHEVGSRAFHD